ncbi:site-specific integrase [Bradyrhizobium neotropicale]|nr:site-specific integrase [Bradyrhizobium neotropicale]
MSEHLLLAPLLESYFRRRLTKQRNATSATLASYRDALRMLILFVAARLGKKPAALALEDLDRDLVLAFLDELEEKRNNAQCPACCDPIPLPSRRSRRSRLLRRRPPGSDDPH